MIVDSAAAYEVMACGNIGATYSRYMGFKCEVIFCCTRFNLQIAQKRQVSNEPSILDLKAHKIKSPGPFCSPKLSLKA